VALLHNGEGGLGGGAGVLVALLLHRRVGGSGKMGSVLLCGAGWHGARGDHRSTGEKGDGRRCPEFACCCTWSSLTSSPLQRRAVGTTNHCFPWRPCFLHRMVTLSHPPPPPPFHLPWPGNPPSPCRLPAAAAALHPLQGARPGGGGGQALRRAGGSTRGVGHGPRQAALQGGAARRAVPGGEGQGGGGGDWERVGEQEGERGLAGCRSCQLIGFFETN
jgi:hypothetical protein